MHTIVLDGREYILRCDLNVIEQIEDRFGEIKAAYDKAGDISATKELATMMINEHLYYTKSPERVTPDWVGSRITSTADIVPIASELLAALGECIAPKNV